MEYFGLQEAAYRLKVSEKTLRRMIHQGRIEYQTDHGRYLVSDASITAILTRKPSESYETLVTRIEATERLLTQLSDRVAELERMVREKPAPVLPVPARPPASLRPTRLVQNGKSGLPDGLIALERFAKMHNIAVSTAKKALQSGRLTCVTGDWRAHGTRVKSALDQAGQRQFIRLFESNPGFKPCSIGCPALHG